MTKEKIAYSYIRFSRGNQIKGSSLRRQLEASAKYAGEHGLTLNGSTMADLGISGFRGKNAVEGALAGFLEGIRSGKVKSGSTLLVESLDRLSRNQITDALTLFLNIINAGVTVVTLMDGMTYSRKSINENPGSLMMSIVIMMRAHEESATKSKRVGDAWRRKREKAVEKKKPLTKICPEWLELTDEGYKVIDYRAEIVKTIFELAPSMGKRKIAQYLNEKGKPTWATWKTEPVNPETGEIIKPKSPEDSRIGKSRGNGWHDSYIQKILNTRAVLGEFQPHRIDPDNLTRVPDGEPIEGYFPAIITQAEWDAAHKRAAIPRGPRKVKIANLFSGLVYDGYTGAVMRYVDKGHKDVPNDWRYLTSDISRLKPGTKGQSWPYSHFEKAVLQKLRTLDWAGLSDQQPDDQTSGLRQQEAELAAQVEKLQGQLNRLFETFLSGDGGAAATAAKAKADKIAGEIDTQSKALQTVRQTLESLNADHSAMTEGIDEFRQLIATGDPASRARIQMEIRKRVKRIEVYRNGGHPMFAKSEADTRTPNPTIEITLANGAKQYHVFIRRIGPEEHHARRQYRDPITHAFAKRPGSDTNQPQQSPAS